MTRYSELDLTVQSDRLPAIAGLARQVEPFSVGRYLAGLWSDSFYNGLLWEMKDYDDPKPRPSNIPPLLGPGHLLIIE
jgi:hypothetical protein